MSEHPLNKQLNFSHFNNKIICMWIGSVVNSLELQCIVYDKIYAKDLIKVC